MAHDFKNYPELTNRELEEIGFVSPHQQIVDSFDATVAKVHDGDTITLRTSFRDFLFPLRFLDVDAPELNAGGDEARDWLKGRLTGAEVHIEIDQSNRVDKYGRLLGRVIHRGMDIGQEELYLGLVKPFSQREEGKFPILGKEFDIKKWF